MDADLAVRELVDEVQVVVETQYARTGWMNAMSRRFEPKVGGEWPLEFTVASSGDKRTYLVTATARDDRGAVVAEARALRDSEQLTRPIIFVRFEAACVRRDLCPKGQTCHAGDCVDAYFEASPESPGEPSQPGNIPDAGRDPGGPTLASEGDECAPEGARACLEESSRAPLECAEGRWRPAPMCGADELCDTAPGALRGMCRQVASECRGQQPNVPFCDRDIMRSCFSSFSFETRPCPANERCVASPDARCECMPGFVRGGAGGCERSRDCTVENGGCDLLTSCEMRGSAERVCGSCPAGYVGDGETGCEPLLAGLSPSAGELVPAFAPNVHRYRVQASLVTQRLTFTPSAPSAQRVVLNGTEIASGEDWTTPTLPLGEYPVKLTLTSMSGAASEYEVIVERTGRQTAYLKPSNTGDGDNFGVSVAMSGDTLVIGSFDEDSAATGVGGEQSDNSAAGAGAVYVFVRRGDQWEQQAYLKPTDTTPGSHFGARVAIDGDTIVVGTMVGPADWTLTRMPDRPGAAYVFTRGAGRWSQTARFESPEKAAGDRFGHGIAIGGDTIAVGAPSEGGDGSVYVFTRTGRDWTRHPKLKASQAMAGAAFGYTVSLSNDTLVVGAPLDAGQVEDGGSAHVFVRSGMDWAFQQRLVPDPPSNDATFGFSLAVHGDHVLVGAPRLVSIISLLTTTESGEVFAYRRTNGTWSQTQILKGILPRVNDGFGSVVALSESGALIGACNDASGARGIGADASRRDAGYAGAAYLFAFDSDRWKVSTYLKASNADALDSFGFGGALSGETAVVSANWEASMSIGIDADPDDNSLSQAGAVYVFE